MNRNAQMDEFLQYFANFYKQNPSYPIEEKTIYSSLVQYGLTEEEKQNRDIESNFEEWINYFHKNPNLHVFFSKQQPQFLQFQSTGNLGRNHVKLCLSYPSQQMEYCVKKIFDYISSHDMSTASSVSRKLRADSVIIRMMDLEEAIEVMEFINNDPELRMYAREGNPFLMKNGKVGVTYDDALNYNDILSFLMKCYFEYCRENDTLNIVSHKDLKKYMNHFYLEVFKNFNELQEFIKLPFFVKNEHRFSNKGEALVNYEQVIRLIMLQLDQTMNLEQYRSFYEGVKDNSKNQKMEKKYNEILKKLADISKQSQMDLSKYQNEVKLLNDYIDVARIKYGETIVPTILAEYLRGNLGAITREQGFRKKFQKNLDPQKLLNIVGNNVTRYVQNYIETKKKEEEEKSLLEGYIDIACKKYGDSNVLPYLEGYAKGDYSLITREDGWRNKFHNQLPPERLLEITGKDIKGFVQDYMIRKKQTDPTK